MDRQLHIDTGIRVVNGVKYDRIAREELKMKILSMSEAQQDALLMLAQSIKKETIE